jgi:hypothetical protein
MATQSEAKAEKNKAIKSDMTRRGYSEVVVGNTVVFVRPISAEVLRTGKIIASRDDTPTAMRWCG